MATTDKLGIINDALALTGNRIVVAADNGSDEWTVASVAYEAAIAWLIEAHSWGFGTGIIALNRVGNSPDPLYTDAFAKPNGILRLVWVRLNSIPVDYKIIGNQVCLTSGGIQPTCKYVSQPTPDQMPPMFLQALRAAVMSGIYRGLNEDTGSADRQDGMSRDWLQQAKTAVDQDEPKRVPFISRLRLSRRVRRGGCW